MLENIMNFFKKTKKREALSANSKETAKERLQLVLMQDRANVSADFLDLMRQEIIEVIKKYIDIDEEAMDVRLTNKENEDGTQGAPALYANIPIVNIKEETKKIANDKKDEEKKEETKEEKKKELNDIVTEDENNEKNQEEVEEIIEVEIDDDKEKIKIEESNKESKDEE